MLYCLLVRLVKEVIRQTERGRGRGGHAGRGGRTGHGGCTGRGGHAKRGAQSRKRGSRKEIGSRPAGAENTIYINPGFNPRLYTPVTMPGFVNPGYLTSTISGYNYPGFINPGYYSEVWNPGYINPPGFMISPPAMFLPKMQDQYRAQQQVPVPQTTPEQPATTVPETSIPQTTPEPECVEIESD